MKLVKEIKKSEFLISSWGIYELSDEQVKKYGKRYALSQGVFFDYALENMGEDVLLDGLREHMYEGFFDTENEAYLTVKTVELQNKLDRLEYAIRDLVKLSGKGTSLE